MAQLILIGPPGAGKGTQGKRLSESLKIPTISMGDLLRDKKDENSDLGRQLKATMAEGKYVSDDIVIAMIRDRIADEDCRDGFILDGFPRTVAQADALEQLLEELEKALTAVVHLKVDTNRLVERLAGRRIAPGSGQEYHIQFKPPVKEGICDVSGEALVQREDDKEDTVRKRLSVYEEQTTPLIDYYRRKGLLREVAGDGGFDDVFDLVYEAATSG